MQGIFEEQLDQVVHSMFFDMIEIPIAPSETEDVTVHEFEYGGVVHLVGSGFRSVVVHCDVPFGKSVAAKMFDTAPDLLEREQIDDTIRELANMIGGNIKSLSEDSQILSPPKTIHQVGTHSGVQEGALVCRRFYKNSGGQKMCVSIYDCKIELP